MARGSPLSPTGHEAVDEALRDTIAAFEAAFPGRVRGYYVEGSCADDTGIATSDLDLTVVFRGGFQGEAERGGAGRLGDERAARSALELDVEVVDEARLAGGVKPPFKEGSRLVYGEDIRDRLPLLPIDAWARDRMHAAYWLLVRALNRPRVVRLPLDYPDPAGEFYGYDSRTVRLPGGGEARSTRNLVRVTGWAATALIAHQAGRYVARKHDCHAIYRAAIGDEWGDLLADIYTHCRAEWNYLIPDDTADRRRLRAICARTLAFENHFLAIYRRYLLAELRGADDGHARQALWLLGQIPFADDEVRAAVQAPPDTDDLGSRAAAAETLSRFYL